MNINRLPHTGIDNLLTHHAFLLTHSNKVGVLTNQSSVTKTFVPSVNALALKFSDKLKCLFSPEHGWSAFCKEGIDVDNTMEPHTNLPIYSLYGQEFERSLRQLAMVDTVIIDLQDVGVRCYTYAATCAKVIEHASHQRLAVKFIVCDRPNPLGNRHDGFHYDPDYHSLINYHNVPFIHGHSIGTLLKNFNMTLPHPVDLTVVDYREAYNLKHHLWIPPSPGLVSWTTVHLYPGLVLLEGTNVSEGRGSTLPFQVVAAPAFDTRSLIQTLNDNFANVVQARPFTFTPTSGKLQSQDCSGIHLMILDHQRLNALYLGIIILCTLKQSYDRFEWIFEHDHYWIDRLTSSPNLRHAIDSGKSADIIYASLSSIGYK